MAYTLIDNPVMMSKSDIHQTYQGKWVFMVNIESEHDFPLGLLPCL